ncbi:AmmeMemoRadiSam system protein B [Candidatus Parcubacteria bacterium]|nr:MAG: AmmeMemoRadiSam system protein B [Candidatus Parcubacteria bacterium]
MNKINFKFIIIASAIVIIAGVILFYQKNEDSVQPFDKEKVVKEYQAVLVESDYNLFYASLEQVDKFDIKKDIRGAIVPHHEVASDYLANFFYSLSENQDVDTFIILGPNHRDFAAWPAVSAEVYWQTDFGIIYQNEEILSPLVESWQVVYDKDNFLPEHSIKVIMPFVKNYFPEATVVPIILTSRHDQVMSRELAEKLAVYLEDDKTVLLSSLDFSHYLNIETARQNDKITLQAIYDKDYNLISNFNSDYLDSPPSLITLLETMDLLDSSGFELVYNSNSGEILGGNMNTTSYIIGYFSK